LAKLHFYRSAQKVIGVSYIAGGLQFRLLENKITDPNKMSLKQFNDVAIKQNSILVKMLLNILTNYQ
jgi:hypothetical protein